MKATIQLITGALCLAASAHAQEAVQWRVEDGGNGHWYACLRDASGMTVISAAGRAAARGAHLFTGCSAEFDFAVGAVDALNPIGWVAWGNHWWGPWIGLRRDGSSGQFSWPDSTSCTFDRWDTSAGQPDPANEDAVMLYSTSPHPIALCHDISSLQATRSALIEWDADCNADGIVDYGQCRDGSLPDYNGNNVPECCERGEPCVPGHYPVQWKASDGGNGHWYGASVFSGGQYGITWRAARAYVLASGGDLASMETNSELLWVYAHIASRPDLWWFNDGENDGPYVGGIQDKSSPLYVEPAGGWTWLTGVTMSVGAWGQGAPNDAGGQNYLHFWRPEQGISMTFDDVSDVDEGGARSLIIEWSADCNADGIVDYGQILQGQLADINSDGVPDICEGPTCRDADLNPNSAVDGADLGALLAFWGPVSPAFPRADINRDGVVNGADLGLLLSFWGPCAN